MFWCLPHLSDVSSYTEKNSSYQKTVYLLVRYIVCIIQSIEYIYLVPNSNEFSRDSQKYKENYRIIVNMFANGFESVFFLAWICLRNAGYFLFFFATIWVLLDIYM